MAVYEPRYRVIFFGANGDVMVPNNPEIYADMSRSQMETRLRTAPVEAEQAEIELWDPRCGSWEYCDLWKRASV